MSYNHGLPKGPFNLPPGCTLNDIDRATGSDVPLCSECDKELETDEELKMGICHDCYEKDGDK